MNLSKKSVALLLSGAAMAGISTHASALSSTQLGTLTNLSTINQTGQMAVKNWADVAIGLGWVHTTKWFEFSVASSGDVKINLTDTSSAQATATVNSAGVITVNQSNGNTSHPAFSLFSVGPGGFDETLAVASANYVGPLSPSATNYVAGNSSSVGWGQVDLAANKSGAFLLAGGATGFVGYANSGATFTNGMGDAIGNGSAGSSVGTIAGHDFAELTATLGAGNYLLAVGNNCFFLQNCGNEVTKRTVIAADGTVTVLDNPTNAWNMANYKLSISAVPVPGAVWLFGSAMAGLIGFGRRKSRNIA